MQNKVQLEAKEEYTLLSLKKYCQTNNAQLYAWDKQFYTSLAPLPTQLKLSLGESLEFVAWIYKKVFGLIIEPLPSKIGELWDTQVRKLGVYENNELIGVIYCDLMSRDGKFDGAAHFTVPLHHSFINLAFIQSCIQNSIFIYHLYCLDQV